MCVGQIVTYMKLKHAFERLIVDLNAIVVNSVYTR